MAQNVQSVFVSYARESDQHDAWVRHLADALEGETDFHVIFDQYDLHAGKDLTHFMEQGLSADRTIIVVTPEYVRKASSRVGGVGYESSVVSAELLENQLADRFVPILRAGYDRPPFLRTKVFVDFRADEKFERSLHELIDALRRLPPAVRPAKATAGNAPISPHATRFGVEADRPIVAINCDLDGQQNPSAQLTVENLGRVAAINVLIQPLKLHGNRGKGEFETVQILRPGEQRTVQFYAPAEGLVFRDNLIQYLSSALNSRDFETWEGIYTADIFNPLTLTLMVDYADPISQRSFRSENALEYSVQHRLRVTFVKDLET